MEFFMLIEISPLGPLAKGRPSPTFIKTGETPVTPLRGGKGQGVVRSTHERDQRAW